MLTALVAVMGVATVVALARSARRAGAVHRARRLQRASNFQLPSTLRAPLRRMLDGAGIDLTAEVALGWWLLAASCASVLGWAMSPVTGVVALVGALAAGPVVISSGRARMRRALDHAVPDLLERTAIDLRGGGTVVGAVTTADRASPLQLAEITRRIELGSSFADAVGAWAERLDRSDVRAAAGAFGLAATVGGRAADALDGLAASMRARVAALADARAQAAQARLSALVVGAAPVAFLAFSAVTDPAALEALVGTSFGRVCLAVGLAMQVLAVGWIRHIVASEP